MANDWTEQLVQFKYKMNDNNQKSKRRNGLQVKVTGWRHVIYRYEALC